MSVERRAKKPWIPPRWVVRLAWSVHRGLYRVFGGRVGLWRPPANGWGALRLTTTGRRTGQPRSVIIGYFEDGPNVVSMAINGWGDGEPAWWLNLRAQPDAIVELVDGRRLVRGRAATGEERRRLWARWREIDRNLDGYASLRSTETAVVVLEPRSGPPDTPHGGRPRTGCPATPTSPS
ncbi:MAG TPA: nitroreductase/quinone reductase family protein [Pilimelia sp.]|nr:nitroreductase/quinone reductase family protein [Pilimelia sp.]